MAKKKQIEQKGKKEHHHVSVAFVATLFSFALAAAYLATNVTGYAVANGIQDPSFGAGVVFFVVGLFGTFLLLRFR